MPDYDLEKSKLMYQKMMVITCRMFTIGEERTKILKVMCSCNKADASLVMSINEERPLMPEIEDCCHMQASRDIIDEIPCMHTKDETCAQEETSGQNDIGAQNFHHVCTTSQLGK